jgi:outer membrane lipase/esterase
LVLAIAELGSPAWGTPVDNVFVFGDSTVDTGWFRYKPLPANPTLNSLAAASLADGGRIPDTPYGIGAAQVLAAHFGLSANPADAPGGGTNYAASGAQNNANFINPNAPSTVSQMGSYLAAHGGVADPNAIYLVSSGGNDVKYAETLSGAARLNWVTNAASALASAIANLQSLGAGTIIVSNGYTVGAGGLLRTTYVSDLFSDLNADGVSYRLADVQGLQDQVFADPGAYGFTSISNADAPGGTALINPDPALIASSWALYGTTALLRTPDAAQTSFWADDEHFAAAAQQLEGQFLVDVAVPEPSTAALFASGILAIGILAWRRRRRAAEEPLINSSLIWDGLSQ